MTTQDEITMALYRNIDVDALVNAKRNGSMLSYLNGIAERIIPTTQNDYRRREEVRPPTPQPVLAPRARENADGTRRREDIVRVSTL